MPYIYTIVAILIVVVIYYMYSYESYAATPVNLVIIDTSGNMSSRTVTSPSLSLISPSDNIVYIDANGNIGVISPADVFRAYPGNVKNLLTVDAANNFSTISTNYFNPCHVNPNGSMNGKPTADIKDGKNTSSCVCVKNWSAPDAPNDGCAVCDGYGGTHLIDGNFGKLAGKNCEYSRKDNCSGHGDVNAYAECNCDAGYLGTECQYGPSYCNNKGTLAVDGNDNATCTSCVEGLDPATKCTSLLCTYNANSCFIQDPRYGYVNKWSCKLPNGSTAPDGTMFNGDWSQNIAANSSAFNNIRIAPNNSNNQYAYGCPMK